jgi:hypothetical protein
MKKKIGGVIFSLGEGGVRASYQASDAKDLVPIKVLHLFGTQDLVAIQVTAIKP